MRLSLGIGGGLIIGFLVSQFLNHLLTGPPIIGEEHTSHLCSCIEDHPEFAEKIEIASKKVEQRIKSETADFLKEHALDSGDFHAVFVHSGNGDYSIYWWNSNRSSKIRRLNGAYRELIRDCLEPFEKVREEAHLSWQNSNSFVSG